jgi:adenine-specific DNA-methyltransferase
MTGKTRLELTWIGKENRPRLEPRILLEEPSQSHHAASRRPGDVFDNILIRGDNLLGLKALESTHSNRVRCVFIDPPYNTGYAFAQYNDGVEHSIWLSLIRDRLSIIHSLLTSDGSIWVSIDDHEMPYLRIILDEIFGRQNFVASVVWQKRIGPDSRAVLGAAHDYIVVYAKDWKTFTDNANSIALREDQVSEFKNPDNDPRGPWTSSSNFSAQGFRKNQMYKIVTPGGAEYYPPEGRCWVTIEPEYQRLLSEGRMWFGKDGKGMPRKKTYLKERDGQSSWTWWPNNEVGHTQESKKESISLFGASNAFATPKPERLLRRIIEIATDPGDIVLDSFAGSGTTGAVAHKMGRRWIMIELGDHCETHIVPRLRKVIDGEDPGGITEAVGWKGGGGYRYYRLAPSLLEKDQFDNWVISKSYNAEMLSEAMCKHFGFTYAPSAEHYWMQGYSSETDFIYVTTASLTHEQLRTISAEVGEGRTLLICCKAFQGDRADDFPNLTLRKIPGAILDRCEWGKDDYSLRIENLPMAEDEPESEPDTPRMSKKPDNQATLFAEDEA